MTSAFFTPVKYETISKISPSSTYLSTVGPTCTHLFHLQKPKNYLMRSGGEAIYRLHPHSRQYVGGAAGLLSCLFFCLSPFKFLWFRPAWSSMDEPKMKKWWNLSYQTQTQLNSTQPNTREMRFIILKQQSQHIIKNQIRLVLLWGLQLFQEIEEELGSRKWI